MAVTILPVKLSTTEPVSSSAITEECPECYALILQPRLEAHLEKCRG